DAGVGRMAAFALGRRAECGGITARSRHDAATGVPWTAARGAALVHAVHGLGNEIVGQMAGVGDRPVVAARARVALARLVAERIAVPFVVVGRRDRLGLVGEGEQFDQVVV